LSVTRWRDEPAVCGLVMYGFRGGCAKGVGCAKRSQIQLEVWIWLGPIQFCVWPFEGRRCGVVGRTNVWWDEDGEVALIS